MSTRVEVESGKYTILIPDDWNKEKFECLRYGQAWIDINGPGSNMILALCHEILKLRGEEGY